MAPAHDGKPPGVSDTSSRADGAWWQRELVGEYLQPLSLEHRDFRRYLAARGWLKG